MTTGLATWALEGGTALIGLDRPERRNALSRDLIAALTAAFQRARDDRAVRSVILTGAGPVFCAGMDLAELAATVEQEPDPAALWDDAHRLAVLFDLIHAMPKPTIAAVQGAAVAGGAGLMSVCDLALAVPEARFGYPEVRRGLVAALVMPHLLRHVGERAARHLLLTGDLIDSAEAARIGLVNRVVAAEELLPEARRWADQLAEGGPEALATTKAWLQRFSGQAVPLAEISQASAAPRLTEECRQGLRAFFAKVPPPWARGGTSPDA